MVNTHRLCILQLISNVSFSSNNRLVKKFMTSFYTTIATNNPHNQILHYSPTASHIIQQIEPPTPRHHIKYSRTGVSSNTYKTTNTGYKKIVLYLNKNVYEEIVAHKKCGKCHSIITPRGESHITPNYQIDAHIMLSLPNI